MKAPEILQIALRFKIDLTVTFRLLKCGLAVYSWFLAILNILAGIQNFKLSIQNISTLISRFAAQRFHGWLLWSLGCKISEISNSKTPPDESLLSHKKPLGKKDLLGTEASKEWGRVCTNFLSTSHLTYHRRSQHCRACYWVLFWPLLLYL